ncbi:LysR family transcriptional regulator [Microterricola viridarii]|uniref:HTH lysR-type domain-containing protein n=1 Tax=Microterricola viridarii TaxID=412690 RepID=A0A0X8E4H3_9MICO|nr:LysR family transcriptional regulator [Microterricola viridarii]AMB59382.1 hypothetical protein AWU67_11510 [Microterricola viridarii]
MENHPFTIRQLEYFEAVATHGSLSTAAAQCHVTASGLAIALDELERNLGVQLFIRRKAKGATLTPLGAGLLPEVRMLLGNAGTLAAHALEAGDSVGGRLAVGCYPALSPFYLPSILEDFARAHPALELEFVEAPAPELHELLLQGNIEVALMYSADISRELAHDPVREYLPHVIVAASSPLAERASLSLAELAELPLIALDLPPSKQNTERLFARAGLRPRMSHSSLNFELVRCLVGRDLGYSILYQRPRGDLSYDGHRVVSVPLADTVETSTVGLARTAGSRMTRRTEALLEHLRAAPGAPLHSSPANTG